MFTPSLLLLFVSSSFDPACLPALSTVTPIASTTLPMLTPDQGTGKSKQAEQEEKGTSAVFKSFPGMIEIPKGKVKMGLAEADAKKLIAENPNAAQEIGAQVGNWSGTLERTFIGPTEVTNEMYLRYVEDTGAMPSPSWAQFTREQRLAIIQELQSKDRAAVFDDNAQAVWWQEHWQEGQVKWSVPAEDALLPVGFISYRDAIDYCRWAGLRLPTEEEWVRAARGAENLTFPFGSVYKPELFAHTAARPRALAHKLVPASSLGGQSEFGLADMSGNLWEWTDSPFNKLPGFESFKVKTKAGSTVVISPSFDAASRVIKGGSYVNKGEFCTVNTRYGLLTHYRAPILGFRVASSDIPCYNAAILASRSVDVSSALMGGDPTTLLAADKVIGLEIRRIVPESALTGNRSEPKAPMPSSKLPAGYAVFDRYDTLAAIPLRDLNVKKGKLERTVAETGPFPIGVLHSTVALEKANTLSGTYIMMYMAPLEAEMVLDLKATLPPKEMIEDYKPKELAEGEIPITDLWPNMEGLTITPGHEYVLLVNKENKGVGMLPLLKAPKYGKLRSAENRVRVNLDRGWIEYEMSIPTGKSDAWSFRFSMVPRGKDGALTRRDSWDGSYFEVVEPKEKN